MSPVTPSELLIALHNIECKGDDSLMKSVIRGKILILLLLLLLLLYYYYYILSQQLICVFKRKVCIHRKY